MKKALIAGVAALTAAFGAQAEGLLQWQDISVTGLYGGNFKVDPKKQQTLTIEYVNGWKYGDTFFFSDFSRTANDQRFGGSTKDAQYGEFSPRLSFGKMMDRDFATGPLQDVLVALNIEYGTYADTSYNVGLGTDLKIPGFNFVQAMLYRRNSESGFSDGWQFTPVWNMSFPVGNSEIIFDGFIDWVFSAKEDGYEENIHFNPQLSYNLGKAIWGDQMLKVGVEYSYWKNKYGIKDSDGFPSDQSSVSFMVKYHW